MFLKTMVKIDNIDYISIKKDECNFLFSLKNQEGDFKKDIYEFNDKLKKLCKELNLTDIGYSNQIHSDIINEYDGKIRDGDAIILNKDATGACVYTADCVPILIGHKLMQVKAAIHSGWKGTYDMILLKTVKFIEDRYDVKLKDLIFLVGPHIKSCCYEVSSDIIDDFNLKYEGVDISSGRMLSLTRCIEAQLSYMNIPKENCCFIDECTKCSKEYDFHSYRNNKDCGRILSVVY